MCKNEKYKTALNSQEKIENSNKVCLISRMKVKIDSMRVKMKYFDFLFYLELVIIVCN